MIEGTGAFKLAYDHYMQSVSPPWCAKLWKKSSTKS
jgi:hypothetical protein